MPRALHKVQRDGAGVAQLICAEKNAVCHRGFDALGRDDDGVAGAKIRYLLGCIFTAQLDQAETCECLRKVGAGAGMYKTARGEGFRLRARVAVVFKPILGSKTLATLFG